MKLPFVKMQAVGNDFVVIDGIKHKGIEWNKLSIDICNRHLGIGSDGLLVLLSSNRAPIRMLMLNPDGTEDMCGNGLRCIARFAYENGYVTDDRFMVETIKGIQEVELLDRKDWVVKANLGRPILEPKDIPMLLDFSPIVEIPIEDKIFEATVLSLGTPHTVIFMPEIPSDEVFYHYSPLIEKHPFFPNKTNVIWAKKRSDQEIVIRIWERGEVGETLGCGTGACAVKIADILRGSNSNSARVISKGGILDIEWKEEVFLSGKVERVFSGSYEKLSEIPIT
ncbi:MAG: diaminopimelate epimerase [bacterium]